MEVAQMKKDKLRGILSTLIHLWRYAVCAMTKYTSTRKKVEKKGGCCECRNTVVFDPYLSSQSASSLSVEEETCLALAKLYDDPKNNNFDCPWDWKNEDR
jgi:hypothetical protein